MLGPIRKADLKQISLRAAVSRALLKWTAPLALAVSVSGAAFADQAKAPLSVEPTAKDNGRQADPVYRGREREEAGNTGNAGGYPANDVHVAVESNARLTHARVTYHSLQDSLSQSIRQTQYAFEHSPELVEALKTEQAAWEDYLAARRAAVSTVVTDPKYQANVALKNDTGEKIAEFRAEYDDFRPARGRESRYLDQARMKQIVTLATVKLDYAQVVTDMEVTALKADPKVADTRGKLMSAGKRVKELRDGFDLSFRANQELAALRAKVEDARIAFITAESFRDGAVEAANTALDYTYYKNRVGGGYGYEYGYTTGYGGGYR
jgi:hypothetical protein